LQATLVSELETYLLAHARENNYQLPTHPVVNFITDPELKLGRFDVVGETLSQSEIDKELGIEDEVSYHEPRPEVRSKPRAVVASIAEGVTPPVHTPVTSAVFESEPSMLPHAALVSPLIGSIPIDAQDRYTIGRKDTCDITLDDSAASRLHAILTFDGKVWTIADNDATNTTQLNGRPISSRRLKNGDVITIGTTQLTFRITEPPVMQPEIPTFTDEAPPTGVETIIEPPFAVAPSGFTPGGTAAYDHESDFT
jgi:hypothetical protein